MFCSQGTEQDGGGVKTSGCINENLHLAGRAGFLQLLSATLNQVPRWFLQYYRL